MTSTSPNLDHLLATLRAFDVSDDFIRGTLFLFAASLMRGPSIPRCHAWQQWLFPHEVTAVADRLLERMHERKITRAIEEFVFKLGVELPQRDLQAEDRARPMRLLRPANHELLPLHARGDLRLAPVSQLYFAFAQAIGRALGRSGFTDAECYLAGFSLFGMWWRMDIEATDAIIACVQSAAPPVLKFVFALPKVEGDHQAGWLPTQVAFAGLLQDFNESFTGAAWPFQSRLFYGKAGVPIAGVERLTPAEFFDHCYAVAASFFDERPAFSRILEPQIDLQKFPFWTGTGRERPAMADHMRLTWGYSPSQPGLPPIEQKQVNACTIMVQFCSMWKRAVRR